MKNIHVNTLYAVFRVGESGRSFEDMQLPAEALKKQAREYADATPAGGWPVVVQTWESYAACGKGPNWDDCFYCNAPGSPIRQVSHARCIPGTGVPESVIVAQELLTRP